MVSTIQKKTLHSILASKLNKLSIPSSSASNSGGGGGGGGGGGDFDFCEVFGPLTSSSSPFLIDPEIIHSRSHSFLGPSPRFTTSTSLPLSIEQETGLQNCDEEEEEEGDVEEAQMEEKQVNKMGPGDFVIMRVVGQGAFGKVFLVRKKGVDGNDESDGIFAMKVMRKDTIIKKNHVDYMRAERDILTKIDHPFIVQLRYSFQTKSKLYLILDFINGGHLFFHLYRQGIFSEDQARVYTAEIVSAVSHLHERGIVHRDLKPENILMDSDGHVMLTDFGMAKEIDESSRSNSMCGTTEYMAPEILQSKGHNKDADWWSVGVLLYEMLTGQPPYTHANRQKLQQKIIKEKFKLPPFLTSEAHSLLKAVKRLVVIETEEMYKARKQNKQVNKLYAPLLLSAITLFLQKILPNNNVRMFTTCQFESGPSATLLIPQGYSFMMQSAIFNGPCQNKVIFQVDGILMAPDGPESWLKSNSKIQWLVFYRMNGFTIQGSGVVDGRGQKWWDLPCKPHKGINGTTLPGPCDSPIAIRIFMCTDVALKGLKILNSPQFNVKFDNCHGVHIDSLKITAPGRSPNTDGIHISTTDNVEIYNSVVATGDDCVSISTGCHNVDIRNITCGPSHGISIGSLGNHNSGACVSNISVTDSVIKYSDNGVRIKTYQGGYGSVSGITFNNIHMDTVRNPLIIDQYYCEAHGCSNQSSAVFVSDVSYTNIKGTYDYRFPPMHFGCSDSVPCTNLTLSDIELLPSEGEFVRDPFCWNAYGASQTLTIPPVYCLQEGVPRSNLENGLGQC